MTLSPPETGRLLLMRRGLGFAGGKSWFSGMVQDTPSWESQLDSMALDDYASRVTRLTQWGQSSYGLSSQQEEGSPEAGCSSAEN